MGGRYKEGERGEREGDRERRVRGERVGERGARNCRDMREGEGR